MTNYRYMLLTSSEDGNPVRWLDPARLRDLLADPGQFGIDRFLDPDDVQIDPNYWPSDVGILLRVEVVRPVPSGAYQLPPEFDMPECCPPQAIHIDNIYDSVHQRPGVAQPDRVTYPTKLAD